jgi:hypothetical protein
MWDFCADLWARTKMKLNNLRRSRLAQISISVAILIALVVVVRRTSAQNGPVHMATDWSHRHLIFSQPHSLMDGFKLSANPRYVQQWMRRNAEKKGKEHGGVGDQPQTNAIQRDWNVYLGNLGTVGAGNYPAKFSFDITAASCTAPQPDFIVYNTSLAGSDTAVPAIDTGTFSAAATANNSVITITSGGNELDMIASTTNANVLPGLGTFTRTGSAATRATNLAAAINMTGNGSFVGVSATSAGAVVTITATTLVGPAGNSITTGITGTPSFTWAFGNFVNGASGVATVAAFSNLYSSCSGSVPSPYWAYNTGTGATAATSVVLSNDGQQVAFVQNTGAGAQLVLLKWAAGTSNINNPQDLTASPTTNVPATSYLACTAPCMTTINFSGGATDTLSSPFYDYNPGDDTLYVGDDATTLHKFTGVFLGTPTETISTVGDVWPAVLSGAAHELTSPVYDSNSGNVFVADNVRVLYRVDHIVGHGTGGTVASGSLGSNGITDSPTVDPSIGNVYVFVRGDSGTGAAKRAGVCQFTTTFAAASTCSVTGGNEAQVSSNATLLGTRFFAGDFDNIYFNSANGTGNLYVCGNSLVGATTATTVWQIPVTAGVLGTAVQGPQIATANAECSPMTEFDDGTTDRIFVSVVASGLTTVPIGCPTNTGCIMSFDITNPATWTTTTATSATAAAAGGTSGVIIDSSTGPVGSSQIYFTPLATGNCITATGQGIGGCAVQASQAAIE